MTTLPSLDEMLKSARDAEALIETRFTDLQSLYSPAAIRDILTWAADRATLMGPNEFEWVASVLSNYVDRS